MADMLVQKRYFNVGIKINKQGTHEEILEKVYKKRNIKKRKI